MTGNSQDRVMTDPAFDDDLLRGAAAIAAFTGDTVKSVYWRIARGQLPHKKIGNTIVASKRKLRAAYGLDD